MDTIYIKGGVSLQGNVKIQGSKNAALPILAASILTGEVSTISNCPKISDIYQMLRILESIGCKVKWEKNGVIIDPSNLVPNKLPTSAIVGMRSSLCMLGAMLGRFGKVVMEHPGGCIIGERPIDLHIEALKRMGASFIEDENVIYGSLEQELEGAVIELPFPSVGATENIILASVMARGNTYIIGAAREPEVVALCEYLCLCGALIEGAGSDVIMIEGNRRLFGAEYRVPADRIVAGTYLFATIATKGCVLLEEAPCGQMKSVIEVARNMGAICQKSQEGLYVEGGDGKLSQYFFQTKVYPGFPTDLQSLLLPTLTRFENASEVEETIFENRFRIVGELQRMGANIMEIPPRRVRIFQSELKGAEVEAKELRGGAALVIAGLMANGVTVVKNCEYIARGYENICKDLQDLGARLYCTL